MSRGRVNTFVQVPFENMFGQTVNPGDKVVFAATAWKNTKLKEGVYDGVNQDKNGKVQSVRVSYPKTKYVPNGLTMPTPGRRYNYQNKRYEDYIYNQPLYDEVAGIGHSTLTLMRIFKIS